MNWRIAAYFVPIIVGIVAFFSNFTSIVTNLKSISDLFTSTKNIETVIKPFIDIETKLLLKVSSEPSQFPVSQNDDRNKNKNQYNSENKKDKKLAPFTTTPPPGSIQESNNQPLYNNYFVESKFKISLFFEKTNDLAVRSIYPLDEGQTELVDVKPLQSYKAGESIKFNFVVTQKISPVISSYIMYSKIYKNDLSKIELLNETHDLYGDLSYGQISTQIYCLKQKDLQNFPWYKRFRYRYFRFEIFFTDSKFDVQCVAGSVPFAKEFLTDISDLLESNMKEK